MKASSLIMAIIFLFLMLPISGSWGEEGPVSVYVKGKKTELNLKKREGRYYIYHTDLIELLKEYYPDEKAFLKELDANSWVAFRDFWENFNQEVIWLDGMGQIVVARKDKKGEIPLEAETVLKEAIADINWIKLKTAEEIKNHLELFYSKDLIEELANHLYEFVQVETDWHSSYQLSELHFLDSNHNWFLVRVQINEYNYSFDKTFFSEGVVKLEQTEKGWRIAGYQYFDKTI